MGISVQRSPRGRTVVAINDITNPSLESPAGGWQNGGWGTGGNGDRALAAPLSPAQGGRSTALRKTWTTGASNRAGAGEGWEGPIFVQPGQLKFCSAQLQLSFDSLASVYLYWRDKSGTVVKTEQGPAIQCIRGAWSTVSLLATAPPTAATVSVYWILVGTGSIDNGALYFLDTAIVSTVSDSGSLPGYFDGSTGSGGDFTHTWEGTADASRSFRWASDPSTDVRPDHVHGYDVQQAARNVPQPLISGLVAATLYPAAPRSGTLTFRFGQGDTKTRADLARKAFAGSGTWTYSDTDNPAEGMVFILTGTMRKYQSDDRKVWYLDVPYQEITA